MPQTLVCLGPFLKPWNVSGSSVALFLRTSSGCVHRNLCLSSSPFHWASSDNIDICIYAVKDSDSTMVLKKQRMLSEEGVTFGGGKVREMDSHMRPRASETRFGNYVKLAVANQNCRKGLR